MVEGCNNNGHILLRFQLISLDHMWCSSERDHDVFRTDQATLGLFSLKRPTGLVQSLSCVVYELCHRLQFISKVFFRRLVFGATMRIG